MELPEQIGRYRISSELGRGGMAAVYHAYDPRFERNVAVKILPSEFLHDPDFRARFEREAKTIAALEHPAVVPVYDFGEEEGRLFLVMRLMQGGSLAARLQQGPMPADEVAHILTRIGAALDVAHGQGIIHRDLKPGNILFDQYGEAYLSDFGIARLSEAQGTLTGSKGALGTPGYMSPEQIQGEKVDSRSDIYALGVILFEMLTGKRPFAAESPAMMLVKQMTEPAPHIREVKPDLPPSYDDVVSRTMAKEPEDRPDTAGEVASLLAAAASASSEVAEKLAEAAVLVAHTQQDEVASQATIVDTPPDLTKIETVVETSSDELEVPAVHADDEAAKPRWGRRLLLLAVMLLIVLAVLWVVWDQGFFGSPGENAAVLKEAVPAEADQVDEPPVEEAAPDLTPILERLPLMLQEGDFEGVVSEANAILAEDDQLPLAYLMRGMAYRQMGGLDEAADDLMRVIELDADESAAHSELSWLFFDGGDYERALGHVNEVIERDPQDFQSYYQRGVILREMGEMRAAMRTFQQYVEMAPEDICPSCYADAQQFLAEAPDPAERDRPAGEAQRPGLGIETIPLDELAPEIPWLPLDMDFRPASAVIAFDLEQAPFSNLFLRRALALALDREQLARMAEETGFAEAKGATTFTHPNTLGRDLYGDMGMPFQPEMARALLHDVGEEIPLIVLAVDDNPQNRRVMEAVADMWREILGLDVEVRVLEGDYFDAVDNEKPGVYGTGWTVEINDPDNILREAFHSQAPFNRGGFSRGDFDDIVLEAAELAGNPEERQQMYIRAEQILTDEETTIIPLFHYYQGR